MKLKLYLFAPDGDFVTEPGEFDSIEEFWDRVNDLGSRWIFYPLPVAVNVDTKHIEDIVDDPILQSYKGWHISDFRAKFRHKQFMNLVESLLS